MWRVPTGEMRVPGLVVDTDVLDSNLRAMAESARQRGIALRPHAKTHKCLEIARQQIALGGAGLSVATVAEAEVFADGGIDDLFIAYPVWAGGDRGGRLSELARRVRLTVGVDSAAGAGRLAAALARAPATVLVEVDCGLHRSGVPADGAGTVAAAAASAGLTVGGVFTFPGHSYGPGAAAPAAADEAAALAEAAGSLAAAGLPARVRSGGSTPSAALASGDTVTELRPGVYVFNDTQQVTMGSCKLDDVALAAVANVVSVPAPDRFVLDTGSKILGADRPPWTPGHALLPGFPGWRVERLWEHHAVAAPHPGDAPGAGRPAAPPRVGEQVIVIPNHVCTVVNLVDQLTVVRGGEVTGRWRVAARGRND
jgi:D-serine deaminase-like pyridoxal phosphate-dependent protein